MKVTINENTSLDETEVIINCNHVDEQILKIIASLKSFDQTIIGLKDGQSFLLNPLGILYIESVDKRVFIYTEQEVYETPLRLYELEERLHGDGFFRASKSTLINLSGVRSLRPDFGSRLLLTMNNGERLTVSRQFSGAVKNRLGL